MICSDCHMMRWVDCWRVETGTCEFHFHLFNNDFHCVLHVHQNRSVDLQTTWYLGVHGGPKTLAETSPRYHPSVVGWVAINWQELPLRWSSSVWLHQGKTWLNAPCFYSCYGPERWSPKPPLQHSVQGCLPKDMGAELNCTCVAFVPRSWTLSS